MIARLFRSLTVDAPCKEASIDAVKILTDGTRVPLGTVAYYHRNPFIRFWWHFKNLFKRRTV